MKLFTKIISLLLITVFSCLLLISCAPEESEKKEDQSSSTTQSTSTESEAPSPQDPDNEEGEGTEELPPDYKDDSDEEIKFGDIEIVG